MISGGGAYASQPLFLGIIKKGFIMRLLYLTEMTSLKDASDISIFLENGYKVIILNTSKTKFYKKINGVTDYGDIINLYGERKESIAEATVFIKRFIKRMLKFLKIDNSYFIMWLRQQRFNNQITASNYSLINKIKEIIISRKIDIVYSSWSITCFKEVKAIQDSGLDIPIIWNIETYPFFIVNKVDQDYEEPEQIKKVVENLEGRIHCSNIMFEYFKQF